MTNYPGLNEAQGKLDAARKDLFNVMQEAKTSSNGVFDMDKVTSVTGTKSEKLAWIQAKNGELAELKKDVDAQLALKSAAESASEFGAEQKGDASHEEKNHNGSTKSLGQQFVESVAFKNKGARASFDVDLKTLFQRSAGWSPESTRSGLVTLKPMIPAPSVIDHIVTLPISQAAYKYMEETTYTNSAAELAEGTTFGQAALALTERSQTVEKVGVWLPMTDEQLEDEPGARAYVEARLENMLRQRLDLQLLAGDGSTPNLLGTVNKAGIQTQALGADTLIDATYKLFTSIRTDGFAEPSVSFVRPTYWSAVALLKTADGQYIYSNPAGNVASVLWGVPVVQTMAAPATTLVTGDYANYAFFGVKRGIDVQVTNSHDQDFINGKQAVRLDLRGVMVHVRPKAFGTVTGLS